jgi:hypothetical protein
MCGIHLSVWCVYIQYANRMSLPGTPRDSAANLTPQLSQHEIPITPGTDGKKPPGPSRFPTTIVTSGTATDGGIGRTESSARRFILLYANSFRY